MSQSELLSSLAHMRVVGTAGSNVHNQFAIRVGLVRPTGGRPQWILESCHKHIHIELHGRLAAVDQAPSQEEPQCQAMTDTAVPTETQYEEETYVIEQIMNSCQVDTDYAARQPPTLPIGRDGTDRLARAAQGCEQADRADRHQKAVTASGELYHRHRDRHRH